MDIKIVSSQAAPPGWACGYIVPATEAHLVVILPIALWVLVEYPVKIEGTEIVEGTGQQFRPYVVNRHGQIADYMATSMEFLCIVPPTEAADKTCQTAYAAWVQGRAALEEAKRQAAEREKTQEEAKKPAAN